MPSDRTSWRMKGSRKIAIKSREDHCGATAPNVTGKRARRTTVVQATSEPDFVRGMCRLVHCTRMLLTTAGYSLSPRMSVDAGRLKHTGTG